VIVQNPNDDRFWPWRNWPKFNPNSPNDVKTEARMDRAVSAIYEPGSTFKLITLAAAFDQDLTKPDEIFDCEMARDCGRASHSRSQAVRIVDGVEHSGKVQRCWSYQDCHAPGSAEILRIIRAFGFGQQTGVDLPGESKGLLKKIENWSGVSIGSISMGQEIGVTPMQLVTAVSAIANGGSLYKPHVVAEMRRGEQVLPLTGAFAAAEPREVIRPQTAATLRRLMEGVVLEGGTGTRARLDGWTAAGKTGSAQKIDPATGRYSPTQLIASSPALRRSMIRR